jgi:hypothetical protein
MAKSKPKTYELIEYIGPDPGVTLDRPRVLQSEFTPFEHFWAFGNSTDYDLTVLSGVTFAEVRAFLDGCGAWTRTRVYDTVNDFHVRLEPRGGGVRYFQLWDMNP